MARNLWRWRAAVAACALLSGCAVKDSRIAHRAQRQLLGLSEVDLESCIGAPDQRQSFGSTDVLTYYAASTSSINYSLPIVGGIGFSNASRARDFGIGQTQLGLVLVPFFRKDGILSDGVMGGASLTYPTGG